MSHTRTHLQSILTIAIAVATIVACNEQTPSAPADGAVVTQSRRLGTLEARLSLPGRVKRGLPITLSVDLFNRGDTAAKLDAPGGDMAPPFDVIVVAASGDTVWRDPPDGQRLLSLRVDDPIAPGDSQPYGIARWDQFDLKGRQVRPGVYRVSALLYAPAPSPLTTVGPIPVWIDR